MEYDDSDFRSQNLQLAGEGNTKYPPVLRPYALPKFDFDENLHGHLRFDSIVETEVLLGIEGNEDNRWIEDYSRKSSEIHFSSTAAETCSIPRRNNVWSEATSLESVEMLLKSVGQDENIPAGTIIKESDACDELGCIIRKMEHSSKLDDNSLSKVEDVKDSQPPVHYVSEVECHIGEAAQMDNRNLGGDIIESGDHSENRIYSGFKAEPVEEKNTVNASMDHMDEPSKIILKGKNDFHEVDESSVDVDSRTTTHIQECENVFKYLETVNKTVTLEGDPSSQRREVEISNMKPTDSEPEKGFVAQTSQRLSCCTEKKDISGSGCLDSTIMVSKSADAVIQSISAQPTEISESNIVPMRDVQECDKVVSVVEEGDTGLGAHIIDKESEVRRSTIIDESGGGSNADELIISESDATALNKSGSAEPFNTLNLASPHTNAGVPRPSGNDDTQNADLQDQKSALSAVDVEHEREAVTIISPEGRLPNLKSSQVITEIGHSLELMKESHSKPQEGLANKVCRESANEMEGDYAVSGPIIGHVNDAEASAGLEKAQKDEEVPAKEVHEKVSGDIQKRNEGSLNSTPLSEFHPRSHAPENETLSADHDKSSCSSLTVITAITSLSQSESEETRVKGSTNQNIPFAENAERDSSNNLSVSPDLRGDGASKGGDSFTFEVKSLGDASMKEAGKSWQSFPAMRTSNLSPTVEGSLSTSTLDKSDPRTPPGAAEVVQGDAVISSERKPRRASAKASGKETSKKGKSTKETTPSTRRKSRKAEKTSMVSHSPSRIGHLVQSGEVQHNGVKPLASLATLTSGLPDLNTSAASAIFHQPFTDLQQVQLHAQIFVYGALIQGTAPDEAYMISAFGELDGGKSSWENGWRTCLERLHGQKSHLTPPETPLQPRSRTAHDQPTKQSASNKSTPSAIASPLGPLSSPLWSIPVPSGDAMQSRALPSGAVINYQQAPTPLHPHQNPQIRTFMGHNASWISQGPFRAPWVASPQPSAIGNIAHFPNTEAVKLTPVKEPFVPRSSGIKHVPASIAESASSASVFLSTAPSPGIITGQQSTDPKRRKRKKNMVSEDPNQIVLNFQLQTEPVSTTLGDGKLSAAVTIPTSNLVSNTPNEKLVMPLFPMTAAEHLNKRDQDIEQRAKLSDETLGKLNEAKINAEDAAAHAAAAISHGQEIWNQMDKQKISGLEPDVEIKLTSAAAAIAAAAAVAKAAAAAANVASNAALQAKMMAEEALCSNVLGNSSQTGRLLADGVTTLTISSSSVILAAREASRRRLEAASAASKRAENIDAIVKAAELVAEAVSQAEKLVAMGEPSPQGKLVKVGPVTRASSDYMNRENLNASGDGTEISARQLKEASADKIVSQTNNHAESLALRDGASEPMKDHIRSTGGISNSVAATREAKKRHKGNPDFVEESLKENSIKEGSLVEVYKNDGGYKAAWYTANALCLKDGKAFVSYTELLTSNESLEKLNECVALEGEDDKAPKVRIARPNTVIPFEGTKKRRRAAMGNYSWLVGDKVDVWAQDGWREGIISEKSKKEDTTLTVHFPAQGETSVVKAWNLRPSLVWKDGEWIECSRSKGNDISLEGDTPQEKRQRTVSSTNEAKGKDISIEVMEFGKPDDSLKLLDLSDNEKIFNLGKNTKDENKSGAHRTAQIGLQKEGSRVVFGVPKQGKKRKFMEVSKHYVADRASKVNEANDSVKFTRTGSRGLKNVPKSELKEKWAAPSKPGKPQSLLSRALPQNENFLTESVCAPDDGAVSDNNAKTKNSVSHVENTSGKHSSMEFQSFTSSKGAAEGPMVFSSTALTSDAPPKKVSNAKSEQASKGKRTARKLPKILEDKVSSSSFAKSTSEVEIRRSNRKIQPTSRLLEGLQSSLIPSVSHDKGYRSQNITISQGHKHD